MIYLFICDRRLNRSQTAATVSRELAKDYGISDYEADYSGIDIIVTNPNVLDKFDRIFVMNNQLEDQVLRLVPKSPVDNLNIKNNSTKESKIRELFEGELRKKLEPHFRWLKQRQEETRQQ